MPPGRLRLGRLQTVARKTKCAASLQKALVAQPVCPLPQRQEKTTMQTSTNVSQAQPSLRRPFTVTLRALLLLTLFLCALLPAPRPHANAGQAALPNLQGAAASEYLKQQCLHASLGEAMAAARYGVYEAPIKDQVSYRYYANNPAQQMQARFAPEGMSLHAAPSEQQPWRLGLKLHSVGYGKRQITVAPGTLSASGNRIEYDRPLANTDQLTIKEWYVNRAEGLEQGFTLAQPECVNRFETPR